MSAKTLRTPAADDDLYDIWLFIAQNNTDAATQMLRKIKRSLLKLERNPLMGRDRPELVPGLRSLLCQTYVVFYRLKGSDIELVRVLHGARDTGAIFESE